MPIQGLTQALGFAGGLTVKPPAVPPDSALQKAFALSGKRSGLRCPKRRARRGRVQAPPRRRPEAFPAFAARLSVSGEAFRRQRESSFLLRDFCAAQPRVPAVHFIQAV